MILPEFSGSLVWHHFVILRSRSGQLLVILSLAVGSPLLGGDAQRRAGKQILSVTYENHHGIPDSGTAGAEPTALTARVVK